MDLKAEIEFEVLELLLLLDDFLENAGLRSKHLRTKHVEIYVRRSWRVFAGGPGGTPYERNCLDIADINVSKDFQRHGVFRRFVEYAEFRSPYPFLILECVHNEHLVGYAERRGWNRFDVNCFWKERTEKDGLSDETTVRD